MLPVNAVKININSKNNENFFHRCLIGNAVGKSQVIYLTILFLQVISSNLSNSGLKKIERNIKRERKVKLISYCRNYVLFAGMKNFAFIRNLRPTFQIKTNEIKSNQSYLFVLARLLNPVFILFRIKISYKYYNKYQD